MTKHIAKKATLQEIRDTLGISNEDIAEAHCIIARIKKDKEDIAVEDLRECDVWESCTAMPCFRCPRQ